MASTAISAQGTKCRIDTTPIKNINSYSGLDGEASEIDVTNMDSAAKEFLLGLKDNGGFNLEYHTDYTDAGQNALRALEISGAVGAFELELSNGVVLSFNVLVKNANSISGGVDATVNGSATLRVTGAVTITP